MKNLIIFFGILFFVYGCKKDKITTYTIKGQLLNCSNGLLVPTFTNKGIDLFQQKNGSNNNSKVLANTNTDSQGNFTFTYSTDNDYDKLKIRTSSGFGFFNIIEEIPIQDLNNLKVILPAYNLVVGLNVTKPYTSNDTLVYGRPDSGNDFKLAGPFISGRMFKATNVLLRGTVIYGLNEQFIPYKINNPFGVFERKIFQIENSKLCGDTVFVTIDIR